MFNIEQFIIESALYKLVNIAIIFVVAWIIYRMSWRIAGVGLRINHMFDRLFPHTATSKRWLRFRRSLPDELMAAPHTRYEREQTLQELLASAIGILSFIIAILASLSEFASEETIVWIAGLFGTALAFAGRTYIGDFLAGISIIFQDQYGVGEMILVKPQMESIEGVVEHVSLTATWLRSRSGELYIIANGEMRFICNYSRGIHSAADIKIKIAATDLDKTLTLLKDLGREAVNALPELREPWHIISETGMLEQHVELTLAIKARFGQAADLRPKLLSLIQEHLTQANITLAG